MPRRQAPGPGPCARPRVSGRKQQSAAGVRRVGGARSGLPGQGDQPLVQDYANDCLCFCLCPSPSHASEPAREGGREGET